MSVRAVRNAIAGNRWLWVALAAGIAVLVVGVALWLLARPEEKPQAHFVEVADSAYILPKPDPVARFSLVNQDDVAFDNAALEGKWSFLFFGFTHCPDLCPTTLAVFNQVHRLLAQSQEGVADVQFVFVSVDPERDTPQVLKEYVGSINPAFVGVTGNGADLAQLGDSLGVVYAKVPGTTADQYFMDHSSAVLLINPEGRFRGVFAAPHVAQKIVAGFTAIREQSR
jgi:protein SCO1/2